MSIYVLGISCNYHNSAAAVIEDGKIIAAAEEERFTRIKGDASFPVHAIKFCLDTAEILPDSLSVIAFYESEEKKFERIITSAVANIPKSLLQFEAAMPEWLSNKLWIERTIRKELNYKGEIVFVPHHLSHAASAFYPSPFVSAAILTADGVGEWAALSMGKGSGKEIGINKVLNYPNSLGLLYSAFTYYTGFEINRGEYKMMGLAPYGKPVYSDIIKKELVNIADDGSFVINQKYFNYSYGITTINRKFEDLFGQKARNKKEKISFFHADIAASIQQVTNEIILKTASSLRESSNCRNLVMSGGVALNVTTNGELLRSGIFDNIWIQPAAGDSGGALGAAMEAYYSMPGSERKIEPVDSMKYSFLGTEIKNSKEEDKKLKELGAKWVVLPEEKLPEEIAALLSEGKIVGLAEDVRNSVREPWETVRS